MSHNEKLKFRGDDEVLKELCKTNGIAYDKIAHEGTSVNSLEIFFSDFPRMVGLSFFPRLCQLTIVGQSLEIIEGLEGCPMLRELWVAQCHVKDITGLESCLQLKKLYLYDNQISKIQNLQRLVHLQVLWLNNNCISEIQGLDNLEQLRELNLAANCIEMIGRLLEPNVNLQNLNLSGNRIKSFKELTHLAHLPQLTELALNDPTSGPNPVCLLCNYATHILYHMPGLLCLDTYSVSNSQVKEVAESTVLKKMMYYNMRVRTVQRMLAETVHKLAEKKQTVLQIPEERIRTLTYSFKNLERELSRLAGDSKVSTGLSSEEAPSVRVHSEGQNNGISLDSNLEEGILLKMTSIRERLALWGKKMDEVEALHEREVAHVRSCVEYAIQFLLMELESVGNIRFEEGCSANPWFSICCDLLHLRFCHSDYRAYDVTGVKINKVIRIHNTALRLRFEEKLQMLLNDESSSLPQNYRQRLEYLFYVPNPAKVPEKEDLLHILENGFKTAEQFKALGREEAIPLSNSLYFSEQYRIESAMSDTSHSSFHIMDDSLLCHGWVILSKVFLGNSTPIRNGESVEKNNYPTAHSVYLNTGTKNKTTTKEVPSSPRAHGSESCRQDRKWFIFDNELVLPEYIIYFEYVTTNQEKTNHMYNTEKNSTSPSEIVVDREVLNMEPVLKAQPKLLSRDEKMLLSVTQANMSSQITVLNLHGNSLSKLKEISRISTLRHLCISFNEFTRLDDIRSMHNLEFLDASFNRLVTLEGMKNLPKLRDLDVRWNKLTRAREDTMVLMKHTPVLLRLDTRHNPWKRAKSVRKIILAGLKSLTRLDDELITEEEATEAVGAAETRITQTCLLVHSSTNAERPRSLSLLSTAHFLCELSHNMWNSLQPDWMSKITALNLDGLRISKLSNLNGLVNLRWASFNDNDIAEVEGLDCCLKLEELSLNDNNITTVTGLLKLTSLNRLSLDGNQLTSLEPLVLEQLSSLTFLSLDKNHITSLHGIQRVRSLLELYIGNNHISTTLDIFYLKGLTNLIILDLHGNPLVEKLENYRIYVVFQISSLKALDGIAVEETECKNAKGMFSGRLTSDMVFEKLGHSKYSEITNLSMVSNSIRMVDLSPADLFDALQHINLDHNNLTSFSGLIYLPNIKSLSLNYNHIESILPRRKAQAHLTKRQLLHNKVHSSGYGQQRQTKSNGEAVPFGSLEPLMGSLEELHLSHNGISNMANLQLSRLTNLKALFLQGNEISQVEGLEGLHLLRELVLDKNLIKVFSENSFTGQGALLELSLSENRVRELSHLEHLTELRKLSLDSNKLQDTAELEKLEALPSLTELCVTGNPVARSSVYRAAVVLRLSQLQILDGVVITVEERTRAELLNTESSPCPQFSTEINLSGLLPLMSRNTLRTITTMSGGLQNLIQGQDSSLTAADETPQHLSYKSIPDKKHKTQ
ncbi:leucine-rich repeat-containing protein 9-like [Boleophthalmus pectinirostris]|uniref:leucine-rich repeat-containing protein 9-like n=1 Tax=Boleophthalmus pectinirostris TaxID=150288 RepID=UPI00242E7216|nr:leucine-rich repeat-containing protein 9-like [Boleophthalmus pectinirostris]